MLCACSGEQFQLDDAPQSPESLATRDFSVSGLSTRTSGNESKFDDTQVDDVETTLKETLSLNYEEARALLGRLEFQRGNFDAALEVFQGIDARGLKARMTKAIIERTRPKKTRSKGEVLHPNVMSLHSVSLLLEAILMKSQSLEELGRYKEAAAECAILLDIVEAAWPGGTPEAISDDCKLKDMFHNAMEFLPKLWKQAGCLEEAIVSYRRALVKPWKLDCERVARLQKDLATVLLYSGYESMAPTQLQQMWGSPAPLGHIEEAILLLSIILRKFVSKEIVWDSEIMDHLVFALSTSGQYEYMARCIEEALPAFYCRGERWYLLALCYSAARHDEVALDLLKKVLCPSKKKLKCYLSSLIFATKLCVYNGKYALEGIKFAEKALASVDHKNKTIVGVINQLLGLCCCYCSRSSVSNSERLSLQRKSLEALYCAKAVKKEDPEVIFSLALVNAIQRNLKSAIEYAIQYSDMVSGSSTRGWKLLALILSAEQNYKEAEYIVDLALDETGISDQLEFLRLKAMLQYNQDQPKSSIETYKNLLAVVRSYKEHDMGGFNTKAANTKGLELDTWLDLSSIYLKLGLLSDSETCLDKAKSIGYFSPRSWHTAGKLLEAQSLYNESLAAFSISLSIEPDYVPSMVSTAAILTMFDRPSVLPVARSFLMNALQLEPMSHEAWFILGSVSRAEGLLTQAADCFKAAYELQQSSPVQDIT